MLGRDLEGMIDELTVPFPPSIFCCRHAHWLDEDYVSMYIAQVNSFLNSEGQ